MLGLATSNIIGVWGSCVRVAVGGNCFSSFQRLLPTLFCGYAWGMVVPLKPPKEWFKYPDGGIPTDKRLTITPEGRVYGYVALWDTCHAGLDECVRPPKGSPSDYGYAHQGETETIEGELVATANIGGGAGHAPYDSNAAPEFYENTSTQLMRVRYGEDDNGLWFSGALWPDASELDIAKIRASPISGDWRWKASWRHTNDGGYDFAGACLVNIPGYPMSNAGSVALGDGVMNTIAASSVGARILQDTGGNIIAVYNNNGGNVMSCGNNGDCGCGKKNDSVVAAPAVEAGDEVEATPTDDDVEQPKLPTDSVNEDIAALVNSVQELGSRIQAVEELLHQVIAARVADNLAS